MSRVAVSMADVILSCRCWIFLIFSAYTMFLMYPHRKKIKWRGGQGIGPPLPIRASGNLSFKTSVTKQLKWGGAPSCIKINLLTTQTTKRSTTKDFFRDVAERLKMKINVTQNLTAIVTGHGITRAYLQRFRII